MKLLITVFFAACSAASAVAAVSPVVPKLPAPPTIPSTNYNLTVPNQSIYNGEVIKVSNSAEENAEVINAAIVYVSAHGGGVIEIAPTKPGKETIYLTNAIKIGSNVDLKIDANTTLKDGTPGATLLSSPSGTNVSDFALTGGGSIDGAATTTLSRFNLVNIRNLSRGLFKGVTVANSAHEHLVIESCSDITIDGVNINDRGTLAANDNRYLPNTDGIDYNGSRFLIQNCTLSDGDDDIVAKSGAGLACSDFTIKNNTIHAGHGISVGGGTSKTLTNYLVTGNKFDPADPTLPNSTHINFISYGLRLKAGDIKNISGGGLATNITFSDNTLVNVRSPIIIESFYNGRDVIPTSPIPGKDTRGAKPAYTTTPFAADAYVPIWQNVLFVNDTATGAANAGIIVGLSCAPPNIRNLQFSNVSISANNEMHLWYAQNVDLSGLKVTVPSSNHYYSAQPTSGIYQYGISGPTAP
jgi:polygalacturonase